jgi:hypothetical protein
MYGAFILAWTPSSSRELSELNRAGYHQLDPDVFITVSCIYMFPHRFVGILKKGLPSPSRFKQFKGKGW